MLTCKEEETQSNRLNHRNRHNSELFQSFSLWQGFLSELCGKYFWILTSKVMPWMILQAISNVDIGLLSLSFSILKSLLSPSNLLYRDIFKVFTIVLESLFYFKNGGLSKSILKRRKKNQWAAWFSKDVLENRSSWKVPVKTRIKRASRVQCSVHRWTLTKQRGNLGRH